VGSGSDTLSASAGAEIAVLLCRLAPRDAALLETAQRLADFALGGQHPAGLFYGRYSLRERSWMGLRDAIPGRGSEPPALSVEESSRIAFSLFDLEELLTALGVESSRYGLAARRMVDACFDSRGHFSPPGATMAPDFSATTEEGIGAVRFLHPLLKVMDRDRRERYRKAASLMVAKWLDVQVTPLDLPASRDGREPDSRAALLVLEAALEAKSRKLPVKGAATLAGLLLPWLYLGGGPISGAGALADSLVRARWKPRPAQIAYICERVAPLVKGGTRELFHQIAVLARAAAGSLPLGCSYVARARWDGAGARGGKRARGRDTREVVDGFVIGPVDARDFAVELGYAVRLEEEGLW
jgi:hypothetical protein